MTDIRNENIGCNVIGGPVYGGMFVAGRNARATSMPSPANPLDQRPALVIAHLPWQLKTPRAIGYWQQLYDEGLVDNECMTLKGRADSAMMAQRLARALDIREVWNSYGASPTFTARSTKPWIPKADGAQRKCSTAFSVRRNEIGKILQFLQITVVRFPLTQQ